MSKKSFPYFILFLNFVPFITLATIDYFKLPDFGLGFYGPYLLVFTLLLGIYAFQQGFSAKELGFRKDNLKKSLIANSLLSLVFIGLILGLFFYNPFATFRQPHLPTWDWYYFRYVLLYCPAQEFIYRSLVFAKLRRNGIKKATPLILISAVTFSLIHTPFLNGFTLFLTLIAGLAWGYIYNKYPNFWGTALSHAILGTLTIAVGLL